MINKLVIIILLLGCFVIAVNAGEIIVSSGTSVDLKVHRSPYASASLMIGRIGGEDVNVVGAAIIWGRMYNEVHKPQNPSSYALVFYSSGWWSTGATNRVDSIGRGKYVLPSGKHPKDIVGIGFDENSPSQKPTGFVFIWFSDGTACTGLFPNSKTDHPPFYYVLERQGTIYCGVPDKQGQYYGYYGYTVASGKRHKDVVAVGIEKRNNLVFAYYRDGTVSAGTSDDLDSKRPATKYQLPTGMTPEDIIDIGIAYNNHVYAFYRTKAKTAPKRFKNFKIKTPK